MIAITTNNSTSVKPRVLERPAVANRALESLRRDIIGISF
jgi:hypothetical protein